MVLVLISPLVIILILKLIGSVRFYFLEIEHIFGMYLPCFCSGDKEALESLLNLRSLNVFSRYLFITIAY